MSVANSKKTAPSKSQDMALADTLTRIRRRGASSRVGRRSALLGVLTSMYANSSRGNGASRSTSQTSPAGNDRA